MSDAILGLGACAFGLTFGIWFLLKGDNWGLIPLFTAIFLFPFNFKAYMED